jgi:Domain of unknown function (DUF4437)
MSRPHIEFLHAQQLPWGAAPFEQADWAGASAKVLSRDPDSGACSMLLRLPTGFAATATPQSRSFECFVIDGSAQLDAAPLGLDAYADVPAGASTVRLGSERGAVLLAFFGRVRTASPSADVPSADVRVIDTHNAPWTRHDIDPSVQFLNLSHKVLRHDSASGEKTLLLSTGAQTHPHDWREARLMHECAEEMYLLGGDIIGERGAMYEGAYFWRPPGRWHGPFGSRRGSLSLIRFAEGHHRNIWSDDVQPFVLEPAHAPELPEALWSLAGAPFIPNRY